MVCIDNRLFSLIQVLSSIDASQYGRYETDLSVGKLRAMSRDGTATRARILDAAQALVLEQGFGGTSVDAVIESAGTTKGGFFHHFRSKQELARALVERYAAEDMALLDDLFDRAEQPEPRPAPAAAAVRRPAGGGWPTS